MSNNCRYIIINEVKYKSNNILGGSILKKRFSYQNKLFLAFIMLSIIPMVILTYTTNGYIKRKLVVEKNLVEKRYLSSQFENYNSWLEEQKKVVEMLSLTAQRLNKHHLGVKNDFDIICEELENEKNIHPDVLNVYYTLETGKYFNSAYNKTDIDLTKRGWYLNAKNAKNLVWSDPYKDQITGEMVVTISKPLVDNSNNVIGVCGLDLLYEDVYNTMYRLFQELNMNLVIFDKVGNFIDDIGEVKISNNEIKEMFKKMAFSKIDEDIIKYDGKKYLHSLHTMELNGWRIVALKKYDLYFKGYEIINEYMLIAGVIAVLIGFIVAMKLSKKLNKPLEDLKMGTEKIARGDYSFQLENFYNDDYDDVTEAFNNMVSNLDKYELENQYKNAQMELRNQELLDMNLELKASYEQLNAAIQQLDDSEKRYKLLVNNIYDAVILLDSNGNINYVNESASLLLETSLEKYIGKSIYSLNADYKFMDLERLKKFFDRTIKENIIMESMELVNRDKKSIFIEISTRKVMEENRVIYVQWIVKNVSKKREMEERILKKNEALTTVNRISSNMAQTLDLKDLSKLVANDLVSVLQVPLVTIRIIEEDRLVLQAYKGVFDNFIPKEDININEDIIGRAFKEKRPMMIDKKSDLSNSPYAKKYIDNAGDVTLFFVPIQTSEEIFGIISVTLNSNLDVYDESILQAVSNQIALRIENINLLDNIKGSYIKTIHALIAAEEAKDKYTKGHSLRVSKLSLCMAKELKLKIEEQKLIEIGGLLHDIGKIGIYDSILNKPDRLNISEYEEIKKHPIIGQKIIETCEFEKMIEEIILLHHKRFDLKGYPESCNIRHLPIGAAIVGVADALDAMTSSRSYRAPLPLNEVLEELERNSGTQFDPIVIEALFEIWERDSKEIRKILYQESGLIV